jgi:hypothetical protein
MIRLTPALFALALFVGPLLVTPLQAVGVVGVVGLLLVTAGIAADWRWPITAAACVFLLEYALALWLTAAPPNIVAAAAVGVGILLLLQAADLAHRGRRATIDGAVVWSQITHWASVVAGTVVAALLAGAAAHGLAAALSFAAAPFLAAAGALGVVIGLTVVIAQAARRASREGQSVKS